MVGWPLVEDLVVLGVAVGGSGRRRGNGYKKKSGKELILVKSVIMGLVTGGKGGPGE